MGRVARVEADGIIPINLLPVSYVQGPPGPQGEQGVPGTPGAQGEQGPAGISDIHVGITAPDNPAVNKLWLDTN